MTSKESQAINIARFIFVIGVFFLSTSVSHIHQQTASRRIHDLHWLKVVAASSMYMYVTHILVLNISRHSLAKLLTIDSDMMMCVYYIINSSVCVIVCITTYFLLKRIKANRLFSVMTGGRI